MKKVSALGAALLTAIWLLSGCTNHVEEAVQRVDNNLKEAVQGTKALALDGAFSDKDHRITKQLSANKEVGKAHSLKLGNDVGDIKVSSISGNMVKVTATIRTQNKLDHLKERKEIMNGAEVMILQKGEQLEVGVHPKSQPNQDFREWAHSKSKFSDFSIDYHVQVPKSLQAFKISNDVGDIELKDLKGTFKITNDVGDTDLTHAVVTGISSIHTDTGDIKIQLNRIENKASLDVVADIGEIVAEFGQNAKCSLEAQTEVGSLDGVKKGTNLIHGGGPKVKLSTSVGSIVVKEN